MQVEFEGWWWVTTNDAAMAQEWARLGSLPAPEGFRQEPPPPVPMPISHFLVRPRRAAAVRTNAAIDASLRGDNVRR